MINEGRFSREEKFLWIKSGDYIRLLSPIKDGLIDLPLLSCGKIIRNQNQVEADIWFYNMGLQYWKHPVREALETEKTKLRGLVIEIQKKDFAVEYNYKDHHKIHIAEQKAMNIPFFTREERLTKIPARWYIGNEHGTEYRVEEIIDLIEENFTEWVKKNTKSRRIYKYERENGDFPEEFDRVLNDKSMKIYYEKRHDLELEFAKITGIYYEFRGGLLDG